jgi:predicted alpha/beta superfamily hydrolase
MFKKHIVRSRIYFAVAALGLVTAWVLNALAVTQEADYLNAWFGSYVDWVLSLDLLVVGIAVITFMLVEARRLGMKRVWLYFLLSGITAMAFTFPLFMAFRERKLLERRLAGGSMEKFEFDNHRVDVWSPREIHPSTPILVIHDGKNIFDEGDSHTGKTWGMLTALREELRGDPPIVIGVWGLSDDTRIRELSPQSIVESNPDKCWEHVPERYATTGKDSFGNQYVSLLADAIVPFVQTRYGITPNFKTTAVMGGSMGGLMSLYAMAKRPDVFGTAICFSTHWIFGSELMVKELVGLLPEPGEHRVWTDTGTIELDQHYPPFHNMAMAALRDRGYREPDDLIGGIYPNSGHHELYWSRRVADALNWWLRAEPLT